MGGKLRNRWIAIVLGPWAAAGCASPNPSVALKSTPGAQPERASVRQSVIALTNVQRSKSVKPDRRLDKAAQKYAEFLARTGKFDHDADGRNCGQRAIAAGFDARVVCENLYACEVPGGITSDDLAAAAVDGWMKSPGHRKNLLDGRVSAIGIGVANDQAAGKYVVVQLLGKPAASRKIARR
jgi:uncharacterized protein YkwD